MTARALAIVVLATACNEVFDLEPTILRPPPVIPTTCTPIGETPAWSARLRPVLARDCESFAIAGAHVTASCLTPFGNMGEYVHEIVEGTLDALAPVPGIPSEISLNIGRQVRRSVDGDRLYITNVLEDSVSVARREGATWQIAGTLPSLAPGSYVTISSLATDGVLDRVFFVSSATAFELEGDGTSFREVGRYTHADLGVASVGGFIAFAMTPDGLRALVATERVYYTDRASLADRFRPAELIAELPAARSLFMTGDCSRAYVSDLGVVFDAERRE